MNMAMPVAIVAKLVQKIMLYPSSIKTGEKRNFRNINNSCLLKKVGFKMKLMVGY
jgi:hypothetical protein